MNSPRVQFTEPCRCGITSSTGDDNGDNGPDFSTLTSEAYIRLIALTPIPPQHDPNNKNKSSITSASCPKQPTSQVNSSHLVVNGQLGGNGSRNGMMVKDDEEEDCLEAMRKVLADMGRERTTNTNTTTTSAAAKHQGSSLNSTMGNSKPTLQQQHHQPQLSPHLTAAQKGEMTAIEKREVVINNLREVLYERFRVHVPTSSEDRSAQLQQTLLEEQCVEHRFLHHTATTAARRKVALKHKKLLKMQHPHRGATVLSSHKRSLEDIISDEEDEDLKTMTDYSHKLHSLLVKQQAARNQLLNPPSQATVVEGASSTTQTSSSLVERIHKKATIARAKRAGAEAAKLSENRKMMEIAVPDVVIQPKPLFSALGLFQTMGTPRSGGGPSIGEDDNPATGKAVVSNPAQPSSPRNVGGKGGRGTDTAINSSTSARQTAQQRIQTWNRQNSPKMSRVNVETGCCDLAGETILAGASQILSPKVKLERRLRSSSPQRSPSRSPKRGGRGTALDDIYIATTATNLLLQLPPGGPPPEGTSGDNSSTTQPSVTSSADAGATNLGGQHQNQPPLATSPSNHKHTAVKFSLVGEEDDGALANNFVPSPPTRSRLENSNRQSNLSRSQHKSSSVRDATIDLSHEQSISNLFGDGYFTNNNNSSAASSMLLNELRQGGSGVGKPPPQPSSSSSSPTTISKSPKKSQHHNNGATTSPSNFNITNKQALLIQSPTATKKRTKSVTEGIELLTDKEYAKMMGLGGAKAMRAFLEEDAGAHMAVPSELLQTRSQRYQIEKASAAAIREQYEKEEYNYNNRGERHLSLDCSVNPAPPPGEAIDDEQTGSINDNNNDGGIGSNNNNTTEQKPSRTTSPLQMDVSCTVKVLSQNHSSSFDGIHKNINSSSSLSPATTTRPPPLSFSRPPALLPPASPHRQQQMVLPNTASPSSSPQQQQRATISNNPMTLMVSSSARPPSSPSKSKSSVEKGGKQRRAAPGPLLHLHDSIASPRRGRSSPPQLVTLGGRRLRSPTSQM